MKRPEEALKDMVQSLEQKTGKSLEAWQKLIEGEKLTKHKEIVDFLKTKHGVSHGFANRIAQEHLKQPLAEGDDPVAVMYSGPKGALKPIRDALMAKIADMGPDVDVAPKKGYESLRRSKQFAILQPSTASRLDVGINLKGVPPTERLEPSGSFNAMLTHRVRVSKMEDIDGELLGWLKQAYSSS